MSEVSGEFNINILFPDGDGNSAETNSPTGNPSAPQNVGAPDEKNPTQSASDVVKLSAGMNAAISLGKQAVNAGVANIGLATGNYYAQSRIQNSLNAVGTTMGLIAAAGNPLTLAVAVGSLAISMGTSIYKEVQERKWENRRAEQYAIMYGFASQGGR